MFFLFFVGQYLPGNITVGYIPAIGAIDARISFGGERLLVGNAVAIVG
jgi:hypothetical protein